MQAPTTTMPGPWASLTPLSKAMLGLFVLMACLVTVKFALSDHSLPVLLRAAGWWLVVWGFLRNGGLRTQRAQPLRWPPVAASLLGLALVIGSAFSGP